MNKTVSRLAFIAALAAAYFALDRGAALALRKVVDASSFRYSRLYAGEMRAPVAVFGNSRGVHAFYAPRLSEKLCTPVDNLAFNGLSMAAVEALVADRLDRGPRPRLIVVELSAPSQDADSAPLLRPYLAKSPRLTKLFELDRPLAVYSRVLTHARDFNSELTFRALYYLRKPTDQNWIIRGRTITPAMKAAMPKTGRLTMDLGGVRDLDPETLRALQRIDAATQARGVPLALVLAPYHPAVRIQNEDRIKAYMEAVRGLHLPGATVVDLSAALSDDHDFADRVHTNLEGAERLADQLADQLPVSCKSGGV
jgi:hypothetical protein